MILYSFRPLLLAAFDAARIVQSAFPISPLLWNPLPLCVFQYSNCQSFFISHSLEILQRVCRNVLFVFKLIEDKNLFPFFFHCSQFFPFLGTVNASRYHFQPNHCTHWDVENGACPNRVKCEVTALLASSTLWNSCPQHFHKHVGLFVLLFWFSIRCLNYEGLLLPSRYVLWKLQMLQKTYHLPLIWAVEVFLFQRFQFLIP